MKRLILGILIMAQALAVAPVFASVKGRQNTAAVLTGAAVYSWYNYGRKKSTGRRNTALLTTAGAAYAWHSYSKAKKSQRRRERAEAAYYRRLAYQNQRQANYYRSRAGKKRYSKSRYARNRYSRARYARR